MSVKAVIFDVDGTLIQRSLNESEVFYKILRNKEIIISFEKIKKAFHKTREDLGGKFEEICGRVPLLEFQGLWNSQILKILEIEDYNEIIQEEISTRWLDISGVKASPYAKSTLIALKSKGLKIGIVSGTYEAEIQKMLEVGGLDETLFDVIVGADTAKRRKPNPEAFNYALRQLEVKPEEAIYVGNELEKDYKAAEKVGIKPFLLAGAEDIVPEDVRKITNLISLIDYMN